MFINLLSFGAVFFLTYFGVELFRRWSLKRELLDIPNQRSSHSRPTPRGGGSIIFAVSLSCLIIYSLMTGNNIYWSYIIGSTLIAGISWIDDLKTISPFLRILVHIAAAGLIIWSFGGLTQIFVPFYGTINLGIWGDLVAFIWIVWLVNAYNFMDGIDGIAGSQAFVAGLGWCFLGFIEGMNLVGFYGGVLAFSAAGFLILNWQPAKIFMGDVGSAFFGYTFAVLPLIVFRDTQSAELQPKIFWFAILFVWFFFFDALFTLVRRILNGEKIWQAHRRHIYQNLVEEGLSHSFVSLLYTAGTGFLMVLIVFSRFQKNNFGLIIPSALIIETLILLLIWVKKIGRIKAKSEL